MVDVANRQYFLVCHEDGSRFMSIRKVCSSLADAQEAASKADNPLYIIEGMKRKIGF